MSKQNDEEWTPPPDPGIKIDEYGISMPKSWAWLFGIVGVLLLLSIFVGIGFAIGGRMARDASYWEFVDACEADGNFIINEYECVDADRRIQEVWHR